MCASTAAAYDDDDDNDIYDEWKIYVCVNDCWLLSTIMSISHTSYHILVIIKIIDIFSISHFISSYT